MCGEHDLTVHPGAGEARLRPRREYAARNQNAARSNRLCLTMEDYTVDGSGPDCRSGGKPRVVRPHHLPRMER